MLNTRITISKKEEEKLKLIKELYFKKMKIKLNNKQIIIFVLVNLKNVDITKVDQLSITDNEVRDIALPINLTEDEICFLKEFTDLYNLNRSKLIGYFLLAFNIKENAILK